MKARDVMVSPVITVGDNDTVRDVAKLLIAKRISAVPVVNGAGKLVGIVTEADLMRRVEAGTEHCYSWWLSFFLGDRAIAAISLSDAAIRKRLMDELKQQRWTHVHKLNVTVTDGVVDLWGFVQSESERQAI